MEKEQENFPANLPLNYTSLDYSLDQQHQHQQQQQLMRSRIGENSSENNVEMVDYMFSSTPQQHQVSLNFGEVMQFADFGPKLALNQVKISGQENAIDPVYFLKFPVLNDDKFQNQEHHQNQRLMALPPPQQQIMGNDEHLEDGFDGINIEDEGEDEEITPFSDNNSVQLRFVGGKLRKNSSGEVKNRRKRPRSVKTTEEVESQRMTHIAVERNRRKQMNEHLRMLRSLMPGSYVQRGDQASIIGGAIEFVRELEQLLQCLESQKRRRLLGNGGDTASLAIQQQQQQQQQQTQFFPLTEYETGIQEETAESKSCLADIEVKVLGFDAMIKILSRRRPGQLLKAIAAFEDLQFNILHTNITTIEQTVLYSFNIKMENETRFTAEEIAGTVQQIFSFIHASSTM